MVRERVGGRRGRAAKARVLLAALRRLDVFGWLRRPEGADVYLYPGRSGLLSHAQHLLGGGRVKVFLAAHGGYGATAGERQEEAAFTLRMRV